MSSHAADVEADNLASCERERPEDANMKLVENNPTEKGKKKRKKSMNEDPKSGWNRTLHAGGFKRKVTATSNNIYLILTSDMPPFSIFYIFMFLSV